MVGKPPRGRMESIRKELVGIQGGVTTGDPCLSTSKALLETLGGGRCPVLESMTDMMLNIFLFNLSFLN